MTRRKRSPSPSYPNKRIAFQIPDSLQQLSALSRTLAQQADTLVGGGQDDQNARITAQAQSLGHALSQAVTNPKPESSCFQKIVPQTQEFPDTQPWIQPHSRPLPQSKQLGFPVFNTQGSLSRPIPLAQTNTPTTCQSIPRTPIAQTSPAQTYNEPLAKEGEPLCLATQPKQIAALIAKKRAENEANNQREKWAQEQFAHRLLQAPDDRLLRELNGQFNQQGSRPVPSPTQVVKCNRMETPLAGQLARNSFQKGRGYLATGEQRQADGLGSEEVSVHRRQHQNHDSLFPSSTTSPTSATLDRYQGHSSSPGNADSSLTNTDSHNKSFHSQPLTAASSVAQAEQPNAHVQAQSQPSKPMDYPSNISYIRQPVQQQQSQHQTQPPNLPSAETDFVPNGPRYYGIEPRLWSDIPTSEILSPYSQSPFQGQSPYGVSSGSPYTPLPSLGKEFRDLTQKRLGGYGVSGQFMEAVQAGQLSDIRTRMLDVSGRAMGGTR
jgi:hypothetical protein